MASESAEGERMSYTFLALSAVVITIILERAIGANLFRTANFYLAYGIVLFFQLVTNGYLTGQGIVTYGESVIMGARIANAPIEDLLFGFALVVLSMSVWYKLGQSKLGNKAFRNQA
jgi:lycopene cyclase domain-containing protein